MAYYLFTDPSSPSRAMLTRAEPPKSPATQVGPSPAILDWGLWRGLGVAHSAA